MNASANASGVRRPLPFIVVSMLKYSCKNIRKRKKNINKSIRRKDCGMYEVHASQIFREKNRERVWRISLVYASVLFRFFGSIYHWYRAIKAISVIRLGSICLNTCISLWFLIIELPLQTYINIILIYTFLKNLRKVTNLRDISIYICPFKRFLKEPIFLISGNLKSNCVTTLQNFFTTTNSQSVAKTCWTRCSENHVNTRDKKLRSENLYADRIHLEGAKERSRLAQITFLRSYPLSRPVLRISHSPTRLKSLRGFSPFFRLPPWRRLAKRSVVLVFVADVDSSIKPGLCLRCDLYVYLYLSLVHLSRAFISVHLSAYHWRSLYTRARARIHTDGP